jgi:prepilin-type N-terminal cleavage/methylation domain-containing protein
LKKDMRGFTLMELVVTLALMIILMAMAAPAYNGWIRSSEYKEAAMDIGSAFRAARSKAIASNLEYEVAFDLSTNKYMIRQGNKAYNTRDYSLHPEDWTIFQNNKDFSSSINLKGLSDCSEDSDSNFEFNFNPNGTGSNTYICIQDKNGANQYRVGVASSITGRVVVARWDSATHTWKE